MKKVFKSSMRYSALIIISIVLNFSTTFAATQVDIVGPVGSGFFGNEVIALPGGNIVVTDPGFDLPGPIQNVGAVYLYNGATGALISSITGSSQFDDIGSDGIVILSTGNFIIPSRSWDNGTVQNAGALTFCSGTTGCSGQVSSSNSLVGSTDDDNVGAPGRLVVLPSGDYVAPASNWDNGAVANVGAVSFCSGTSGCSGTVSLSNSLIGATAEDRIGEEINLLSNGNYVVRSPNWDNGATVNVGAATFCTAGSGCVGTISAANSLIGSTASDLVSLGYVTALTNGNYVVSSLAWNNGAASDSGAVTFCSGTTGCQGPVTTSNSLVGTTAGDNVGNYDSVYPLANGNYVVGSRYWDNVGAANAGATTFCDGTTGCTGAVSSANSLVGTAFNDEVGLNVMVLANGNYVSQNFAWNNDYLGGNFDLGSSTFCSGTTGCTGNVTTANSMYGTISRSNIGNGGMALSNGDYLLLSLRWHNPSAVMVGAVTYCSGTTGCTGAVASSNSLTGANVNDQIGRSAVELSNGNAVVWSTSADNGGIGSAGAVTFCTAGTGCPIGPISPANSLVGSTISDSVGNNGVIPLNNGNYIVLSTNWDDGGTVNAGAATFCSGTAGCTGAISSTNSLVGSSTSDGVGNQAITVGSNYVVSAPNWDNGGTTDVGAVMFCDGAAGCVGPVNAANALTGATSGDRVGSSGIYPLSNGNYIVWSPNWDNPAPLAENLMTSNAGAITIGNGSMGTTGNPMTDNSVLGTIPNGGGNMNYAFDASNNQVAVGRSAENIVTLFLPAGPTAAASSISGRVRTAKGNGIARVSVMLSTSTGQILYQRTNQFGYFRFDDLEVGQDIVLLAESKSYQFDPRFINFSEEIVGLELIPR